MDKIDRAIIDILRSDARISNVALAEKVNLTPGPCLRRVQKLEADGVLLGYRAAVNPDFDDRAFEILLDIELTDFSRHTVAQFEASMAAFPEVVEIYRLFGQPDYYARVAVRDLPTYERFLSDTLLALPGIQRVSSKFPMKVVKSLRPQSAAATGAKGVAQPGA